MVFTAKPRVAGQIILIDVDKIYPNKNQPRTEFSRPDLEALAVSIKQNGIIQPLTVRKRGEKYELIAGERRLRASKMANLRSVPCIIMDADDKNSAVYALIENIQRKELNFIEEAKAVKTLAMYYGMRQEDIAACVGKTQSSVSNLLRVLKLPEDVQKKLTESGLTQRHARALLKLSPDGQREAVNIAAARKLNVEQTERLVEKMLSEESKPKRKTKIFFKDIRIFVNTINHAVETMQNAGIKAKYEKTESEDCITFTVRVPKNEPRESKADDSLAKLSHNDGKPAF